MTHDRDPAASLPIVFRAQRAADCGSCAEHRKKLAGYNRNRKGRCLTFAEDQTPIRRAHRGEALKASHLPLPGSKGEVRDFANRRWIRTLARPDHDDAIRFPDRQRTNQNLVNDTEDGGGRADGNRKSADCRQRRQRRAAKRAHAESQVVQHQSASSCAAVPSVPLAFCIR